MGQPNRMDRCRGRVLIRICNSLVETGAQIWQRIVLSGLFLVSCSTAPPTSFCDDVSLSEPAANYSVTYIRKPDPQLGDLSYWNLCGPAWTRGAASLTYSPAKHRSGISEDAAGLEWT